MQFDDLIEKLHGFGRHQWVVVILSGLVFYPISFNHMFPILGAASPNFRCSLDPSLNISDVQSALRSNNASDSIDQCSVPVINNRTRISEDVDCEQWIYDKTKVGSTIVTEWDLVCGRAWLVSTSTSVYMAGLVVGLLPIGALADKIGRRKAMLLSVTGMTAMMFAVTLAPNVYVYMAVRFLMGFFTQGLGSVAYCWALECVGVRFRLLAGLINGAPWSFGIMSMAAAGTGIKHWRTLALLFAGMSALVTVSLFVFARESARWLYASGKVARGEDEVRRIARMNRRQNVFNEQSTLTIAVASSPKSNPIHLLKTPMLRKRILITWYLWFVVSFVYFGLFLNASSLSISVYVNLCLGGLLDLAGGVIKLVLLTRFGRRIPGIILYFTAGICLLLTLAFDKGSWVVSALAITGRMVIGISFGVAYIYTTELAPTVLRSNALAAGNLWARIGGVLAPFVGQLDRIHPALSTVVFGIMPMIGGSLIYLFPETKGANLPDTIEDVEHIKEKCLKWKDTALYLINSIDDSSIYIPQLSNSACDIVIVNSTLLPSKKNTLYHYISLDFVVESTVCS